MVQSQSRRLGQRGALPLGLTAPVDGSSHRLHCRGLPSMEFRQHRVASSSTWRSSSGFLEVCYSVFLVCSASVSRLSRRPGMVATSPFPRPSHNIPWGELILHLHPWKLLGARSKASIHTSRLTCNTGRMRVDSRPSPAPST